MFTSIRASKTSSPTAVVCAFTSDLKRRKHDDIPQRLRETFACGIKQAGFKAQNGETILVEGKLLIVGGGDRDLASSDTARKAGARFAKEIERFEINSILVHPRLNTSDAEAAILSRAFAEGIGLSQWRLQGYDGTASKDHTTSGALSIAAVRSASNKALKEGLLVANATNEARRIAATPPNVCNPAWVAKEAKKANQRIRCWSKVNSVVNRV